MLNKKETVAAVVVTYNRKLLLRECLNSLLNQTQIPDSIIIVDNNSTDGTEDMLKNEYLNNPIFDYMKFEKNLGGAGGFHYGMKRAYEKGFDWIWLMDDDTITKNDSLEKLHKKRNIDDNIGFLCSKVIWNDATPHLMNIPQITPIVNNYPFNYYEDKSCLIVNSASFVSLLVSRIIIKIIGFPIEELFIWGDDIEFSNRVGKIGKIGLYVNDSIVQHKTLKNHTVSTTYDWRYYYNIRNNLFFIKKINFFQYLLVFIINILKILKIPKKMILLHFRALINSILFNPSIKYPKDSHENHA